VVRELVFFPNEGRTVVGYGCSDCHWRYDPLNLDELESGGAFLNARILFDVHDCQYFKFPPPEPKRRREWVGSGEAECGNRKTGRSKDS
jgi:hypothetical protein